MQLKLVIGQDRYKSRESIFKNYIFNASSNNQLVPDLVKPNLFVDSSKIKIFIRLKVIQTNFHLKLYYYGIL